MSDHMQITSAKNPFYKELTASLKGRGAYSRHIRIDGTASLEELLVTGHQADVIAVTEEMSVREEFRRLIVHTGPGTRTVILARHLFEKVSVTRTPAGIMAWVRWPWQEFDSSEEQLNKVLLLDRVQDPGNVGTLIRSAAAFGLDAVVLTAGSALPWGEKTVRASMGSVFRIPVYLLSEEHRLEDWQDRPGLIAADAGGNDLRQFSWPERWILTIGNEGQGISADYAAAAEHTVSIFMKGGTESLNAAVAGSIMLFEASR